MSVSINKDGRNSNNLAFIREVARYFMDFLETDFHKRKNPKRSVQFRDKNNLLVGFNLNKYQSFNNSIWRAINHGFKKDIPLVKGVYKTNIPKNLLDLIKVQLDKISSKNNNKILSDIEEEIRKSATLYKREYDKALNVSLEGISRVIKNSFVLPFIKSLEKPLENLDLGDENDVYLMEEELTSILLCPLENKISEILKKMIVGNEINVSEQLKKILNTDEIKNNIFTFFENFKISDLFSEIFEMERNRSILDKQEFYLYFYDITFNKVKYPIFYIPFVLKKEKDVEKKKDVLMIEFDSQVYINKKALEYISQEYNKEKEKKGSLELISDRIIYLSQHQDLRSVTSDILSEIVNFFDIDQDIDVNNPKPQASKNLWTRISNSCYITLFDKSDEALVNDYEDILKLLSSENNILAGAFNKLINDFVYKNPNPSNPEIENEWDNTGISDKLVFASPISLNSEQLQILSAIRKDDCGYITVEGPPGTGKSHTITAVIFDAILKNQSVLVLSDKKEALDVVEDKITETMNKVRRDKNFQNPILRLGKTGNTYNQILSTTSIEDIKNNYRAVKKDYDSLEQNINKSINSLKEDLEAEILAYDDIDINEIFELLDLELYYNKNDYLVDIEEVLKRPESAIELEEFRNIFKNLESKIEGNNQLFNFFGFSSKDFDDLPAFKKFLNLLIVILDNNRELREIFKEKISLILKFKEFSDKKFNRLEGFIKEYEDLNFWIFGYFLKGKKIKKLNERFKEVFLGSEFENPHNKIDELKEVVEICSFINNLKERSNLSKLELDYLNIIHEALKKKEVNSAIKELAALSEDIKYLENNFKYYPETFKNIKVDYSSFVTLYSNRLAEMEDLNFDRLVRYVSLKQRIKKEFEDIQLINYAEQKKNIEDLVTAQMTYKMDSRVINFYDYNKSDARALRDVIRSKNRFPKEHFLKLKEAFPCILAGIRDYAEYIPLEPEVFDLVIIDEASQVSIAQAFPALLRAKKILILGDRKQFSNVKSAQARTDTNKEYLNNLEASFKNNISEKETELIKLKKFDIKTSILEFFSFINNYNTQLLKHFRGYKEIISYSNKYFYQDSLQVMKIRGKPIDEVLKFSFIKHDGKEELFKNANTLEAEYIISEIKKLKDKNSCLSVGIITPHTNQQKLLVEMINKLPEKDYFFDKLQLKIMTFDTCQGEERDMIFYSMVATKELDRLWGVFIKDLNDVDIEEDGIIKAQRLNVGFSRAKECMNFVLSKSVDDYNGSIGDAIRHYYNILSEAKKEKSISATDKKSKMEPEVMNWFYQTSFWNDNKDNIEFMPQFEIGKYLRQLDRTYHHPNYRVDFLLIYKDETYKEHKIVIEYDGFKEHFRESDGTNEFNYQDYYSDNDVYREKVLESYGYKFLRINKFNVGDNPITALDERIRKLLKRRGRDNGFITNVHKTVEKLQSGAMKECPKCKKVRRRSDFKDDSLITGYGRFCKYCKPRKLMRYKAESIEREVVDDGLDDGLDTSICPICGSSMVLRSGRYGEFFGCSRFPYCRGTRKSK